jgi:hypothetical protein
MPGAGSPAERPRSRWTRGTSRGTHAGPGPAEARTGPAAGVLTVVETGVDPVTFRFSDANRRISLCRSVSYRPHLPWSEAIHRYETIRGGTLRTRDFRGTRGIFAGWSGSDRGPQRARISDRRAHRRAARSAMSPAATRSTIGARRRECGLRGLRSRARCGRQRDAFDRPVERNDPVDVRGQLLPTSRPGRSRTVEFVHLHQPQQHRRVARGDGFEREPGVQSTLRRVAGQMPNDDAGIDERRHRRGATRIVRRISFHVVWRRRARTATDPPRQRNSQGATGQPDPLDVSHDTIAPVQIGRLAHRLGDGQPAPQMWALLPTTPRHRSTPRNVSSARRGGDQGVRPAPWTP